MNNEEVEVVRAMHLLSQSSQPVEPPTSPQQPAPKLKTKKPSQSSSLASNNLHPFFFWPPRLQGQMAVYHGSLPPLSEIPPPRPPPPPVGLPPQMAPFEKMRVLIQLSPFQEKLRLRQVLHGWGFELAHNETIENLRKMFVRRLVAKHSDNLGPIHAVLLQALKKKSLRLLRKAERGKEAAVTVVAVRRASPTTATAPLPPTTATAPPPPTTATAVMAPIAAASKTLAARRGGRATADAAVTKTSGPVEKGAGEAGEDSGEDGWEDDAQDDVLDCCPTKTNKKRKYWFMQRVWAPGELDRMGKPKTATPSTKQRALPPPPPPLQAKKRKHWFMQRVWAPGELDLRGRPQE